MSEVQRSQIDTYVSMADLREEHGHTYVSELKRRIIQAAAFRRGFRFRHQKIKVKQNELGDADGHTAHLSLRVKVAFGGPQFTILSLYMLLAVHATLLYEFLGAPLSFIAFFTALARSIDVMSDPIMSWVTDSSRTRWGRRMPFMVTGCLFYAVAAFLLLGVGVIRPPGSNSNSQCVLSNSTYDIQPEPQVDLFYSYWYGAFFIIFYLTDTYCNVPYNALGPELTDDYIERNSVYLFQNVFGMVGTMVGAVAPPALEAAGISKELSFAIVGAFFGGFYMLTIGNLVWNVSERLDSQSQLAVDLVPSMIRSFRNPAFTILLAAWLIDAVGWFSLSAMLPFYVKYYLEPSIRTEGTDLDFLDDDTFLGVALLCLFVCAILGMPFWNWVSHRIGKYKAWLAYNLFNGISNALFAFVNPGDWELALIVTALNGIPLGGKFLSDSTLADTIDYDEFLTGQRREAQFTMFSGFVPKIVSIPSQALPIAIIAAVGFEQSVLGCDTDGELGIQSKSQSDLVRFTIQMFFILMPVAANIISFAIKTRYPIKSLDQYTKISAGIVMHRKGFDAKDPVSLAVIPSAGKLTVDQQRMAAVLDHFFLREQRLLARNNCNARPLVFKLVYTLCVTAVICGGSIVGVIFTFGLLENPSLSWIPSLFQIFVGFSFMSTIFTALRLRQALKLSQDPIEPKFIKRWVKLNTAIDNFDLADPLEERPEQVLNKLFEDDEDDEYDWNEKPTFAADWNKKVGVTHVGSRRNLVQHVEGAVRSGMEQILGGASTTEVMAGTSLRGRFSTSATGPGQPRESRVSTSPNVPVPLSGKPKDL